MNSSNGIFLESFFATIGIAGIILFNNGLIAILCFIVVFLVDTTWSW